MFIHFFYPLFFLNVDRKEVDRSVHLHPELKEPGLYCFLLRCGKEKTEPFMKWVVETVLPREVRKLAQQINIKDTQHRLAIEEKDSALALLNDDLEDRDRQIVVRNQEIVTLNGR